MTPCRWRCCTCPQGTILAQWMPQGSIYTHTVRLKIRVQLLSQTHRQCTYVRTYVTHACMGAVDVRSCMFVKGRRRNTNLKEGAEQPGSTREGSCTLNSAHACVRTGRGRTLRHRSTRTTRSCFRIPPVGTSALCRVNRGSNALARTAPVLCECYSTHPLSHSIPTGRGSGGPSLRLLRWAKQDR